MLYADNGGEGDAEGSDIEGTVDDLAATQGTVASQRSFDRCVVNVLK